MMNYFTRANRFYVGDFALIHFLCGTRPSFFSTFPTLPFYNVFVDFGDANIPPAYKYVK